MIALGSRSHHSKSIAETTRLLSESMAESEISIHDVSLDDFDDRATPPFIKANKKEDIDSAAAAAMTKKYLEPINFNILKKDQLPMITRAFALNRLNNGKNYNKNFKHGKPIMPKINFQKSNFLSNQLFYEEDDDEQSSQYNNDWSKQSVSAFLTPIETFLENQRQREKSSRRRCNEIVKIRSREYSQKESEFKLKEYDDKINLNLLMKKKSKETASNGGSSVIGSSGGSGSVGNYRAILAQETVRNNQECKRCSLRKRKQEEQFLKNCLECSVIKEIQRPKLPRILPKLKLYDSMDDVVAAPFSSKRKSIGNLSSSSNNDMIKSPNGSLKAISEYSKQMTPQKTSRKNSNN